MKIKVWKKALIKKFILNTPIHSQTAVKMGYTQKGFSRGAQLSKPRSRNSHSSFPAIRSKSFIISYSFSLSLSFFLFSYSFYFLRGSLREYSSSSSKETRAQSEIEHNKKVWYGLYTYCWVYNAQVDGKAQLLMGALPLFCIVSEIVESTARARLNRTKQTVSATISFLMP